MATQAKISTDVYDLKTKAKIARRFPYSVSLKAGEVKYWCSCGHSKTQPFCDGAHSKVNKEQGTNFVPLKYEAAKDGTVYLCACKQTKTPPLCDLSHAQLIIQSVGGIVNSVFPLMVLGGVIACMGYLALRK